MLTMSLRLAVGQDHGSALITPGGDACSSRGAGSFAQGVVEERDARTADRGNKQGTSNCGIQPLTTITSIAWIHARSGQPLVLMLNGTVRGLTYKQEAGGSSPSPPISTAPANRPFRPALSLGAVVPNLGREQASRHAASAQDPGRSRLRARLIAGTPCWRQQLRLFKGLGREAC